MLTGKMISETLANDEIALTGMSDDQITVLQEYAEDNLPQALENFIFLPATYGNVCLTIAACLKEMVRQGIIVRILMRAPCCGGGCGGGVSPEFAQTVNAEYLSMAETIESEAADEPTNQETALWQLGVEPEHIVRMTRGEMTVGDLLAVQPFLFMHPHRR
jgi:hypothetical protein